MPALRSKPKGGGSDTDKDAPDLISEAELGDTEDNKEKKVNGNDEDMHEVTTVRIHVNENAYEKDDQEEESLSLEIHSDEILEHAHNKNVTLEGEGDNSLSVSNPDESEISLNVDEMTVHANCVSYHTDIV